MENKRKQMIISAIVFLLGLIGCLLGILVVYLSEGTFEITTSNVINLFIIGFAIASLIGVIGMIQVIRSK